MEAAWRACSSAEGAATGSDLSVFILAAVALLLPPCPAVAQSQLVPYRIVGDAAPEPLGSVRGDAARGRAIVLDPDRGNCTICHPVPGGDPRAQGNVGPPLAGVAERATEGQLRLRVIDGTRINPATIMPPYYRTEGITRAAEAFRGKPILQASEVEDVVAYLLTLRP